MKIHKATLFPQAVQVLAPVLQLKVGRVLLAKYKQCTKQWYSYQRKLDVYLPQVDNGFEIWPLNDFFMLDPA